MAGNKKFYPHVSGWLLVLATVALCSGCVSHQQKMATVTYEGPPTAIGAGEARSFVTLDAAGKPETIGIRLSAMALRGLPAEEPKDAIEWEYLLRLPPQAAGAGYDHIAIDWNPHGHVPQGVYDKPHFDFHFYFIDSADRERITAVGADLERAHRLPAAQFMPAGYILPPGTEVPRMGAHAVDPKGAEFSGQGFTNTFIYGFYDGRMIFVEPMITTAFLETKPVLHTLIAVPEQYPGPGYYPIRYGVVYDHDRQEYEITLDGLTRH